MNIIYFKDAADNKLCLFAVLYVTALLANLTFGYRYIAFGPIVQSGGILIFPLSFIISDIVTEFYGRSLAKKLVTYGIICQIVFSLYAYYVSHSPAPNFLKHKEIYEQVFSPYLKFSIASSIAIWIGAWVNIVLLTKLTEYYGGKYFALRSFLSSTIAELIVTVVSMVIANLNRMDLRSFTLMIACCFLMKTLISFLAIFPASLIVDCLQNNKTSYLFIQNIRTPIK